MYGADGGNSIGNSAASIGEAGSNIGTNRSCIGYTWMFPGQPVMTDQAVLGESK